MKTKEELNAIREEVVQVEKTITSLDRAKQKECADKIDGKLKELSDDEFQEVVGGTAFSAGNYSHAIYRHKNCGGIIENVGNPFRWCYCDTCGEEHYWHYDFEYTIEYEE